MSGVRTLQKIRWEQTESIKRQGLEAMITVVCVYGQDHRANEIWNTIHLSSQAEIVQTQKHQTKMPMENRNAVITQSIYARP
jgi:hypothetical protein